MEANRPFMDILRKHFPCADIHDWEECFVHEYMDEPSQFGVVNKADQLAALSDLEKHLNLSMQAYAKLHPQVRQVLDKSFGDNTFARTVKSPGTTLAEQGDKVGRTRYLSNYFMSMIYSLTGRAPGGWDRAARMAGVPLERQPSAIEAARRKLDEMRPLTGKAAHSETWRKIALVERALTCWRRYGSGDAKLNSQAFQHFLQDLSNALGREGESWDAGDLVATYRRRGNLS